MLSTLGFTCVAFVTGALAFWGPIFITSGLRTFTDRKVEMGKWVWISSANLTFTFCKIQTGRSVRLWLINPYLTFGLFVLFSVSLVFGVVTMLSGLIGVPTGMFLSTSLKKRNPRADPLICAFGLLTSTPLMFLAAVVAGYNEIATYALIFFASLCLNLNWSIVADMLLVSY